MTHHFQKQEDQVSLTTLQNTLKAKVRSGLFSDEQLQPLRQQISQRKIQEKAANQAISIEDVIAADNLDPSTTSIGTLKAMLRAKQQSGFFSPEQIAKLEQDIAEREAGLAKKLKSERADLGWERHNEAKDALGEYQY